jgi:hypothetical protein
MKALWIALAALAVSAGGCTGEERAPVDYGQPSSWLCRPGRQDACVTNLDAVAFNARGERTPKPFRAASDPGIDCFYVYPTVSAEPSTYADMTAGPAEIAAAQSEAARYSATCRVFAPIYRQVTLAGLRASMLDAGTPSLDGPYADIRDAWRVYLAHDNHGRGVVLIGHSQGAILLTRLIAEEIDGKPAQKLLVSAYLAGDLGFSVPAGKDVGGTFKTIPLCRSDGQFGCALVWSTYQDGDMSSPRFFGVNPGEGLVAACTNPAAPAGGPAPLEGFIHKPAFARPDDPPWVEMAGQLTGACVSDAQGVVLRVRTVPGPLAPLAQQLLELSQLPGGWGLHLLDMNLVQGNLLDLAQSQGRAWSAARGPTTDSPR